MPPLQQNYSLNIVRAAAIVLVVLFHIPGTVFNGGFIGVDMFFVLSGYLIALKLPSVENWLGVKKFWVRRVRKIFPSMVVVIVFIVGVFYYNWGWCEDLIIFLLHGVGSLLGMSTFDYAVNASGEPYSYSPFLHLWSVAAELHFYLLAPLFALLVFRRKLDVRKVALAVGVASFVLWVMFVAVEPNFAYYFTPTRIWEFLLGAAVGLKILPRILVGRRVVNIFFYVSIFGFTMLPANVIQTFPTLTIIPVFATVLFILHNQNSYNQQLDSQNSYSENPTQTKPNMAHNFLQKTVTFTANISYPLYLIHYPVFFYIQTFLPPQHIWVGIMFSVLAAWFIHTTVEKPFLKR